MCFVAIYYLRSNTRSWDQMSVKYKNALKTRAQLFEGRLALNPGLNLTWVSFSCVQKHFL